MVRSEWDGYKNLNVQHESRHTSRPATVLPCMDFLRKPGAGGLEASKAALKFPKSPFSNNSLPCRSLRKAGKHRDRQEFHDMQLRASSCRHNIVSSRVCFLCFVKFYSIKSHFSDGPFLPVFNLRPLDLGPQRCGTGFPNRGIQIRGSSFPRRSDCALLMRIYWKMSW
jgi:hypothetical protein